MEVIHGCEQDLSSTWADIAKILSLQIWEEHLQPLVLKQESSRLDDGRDPRVRAGLVLHLRGHHPPHWQAQTGHLSRWGCFNNICIMNYCYLLQTLCFRRKHQQPRAFMYKIKNISGVHDVRRAGGLVLRCPGDPWADWTWMSYSGSGDLDLILIKWWWHRWWWSWQGGRQWQWW